MPYYAMVVVVEAPDADEAHRGTAQIEFTGEVNRMFVGDPWECKPVGIRTYAPYEPEFDTVDAIEWRQR